MTERRRAFVLLVAAAVVFGGTWPAGALAADGVPPATVAACRFALAAVLLLFWGRARGARVGRPDAADIPLLLGLGGALFAYNLCFLYGLRLTPATDGSILVPGLSPVVTAALSWPLRGERPRLRTGVGLAVALAGLLLVVDPVGGLGRARLEGDGILACAAIAWALYTLLDHAATRRFDAVRANVYATRAAAVMLLPLSFVGGGWGSLARAPVSAWLAIAYLGAIATVIGFVVFYEGVRLIGSGPASAFTLLVPIFGVLASVVVLGDALRPLTAVGGVAVLAGLAIVQRRRREFVR